MADAQTNAARIGYAIETSYGGSIPSAALKTLRFTEESIAHNKNAQWSNEIDANGDRKSVVDISKSSAGTFTSELSYTDFLVWLTAAIRAGSGSTSDGVTKYTNGTTLKSFYLEKQFTDISALIGCYGMAINELTLTLAANAIVTAQFGLIGKELKKESSTRGTGPITAAATDKVLRCGADVANLKLDGSSFPCAVQQLTLNINNNLRPKTEIGSASPTAQNIGSIDVSGSMRCYFPSTSLFDQMLSNTNKSLSFDLANEAGRFGIELPAITLGSFAPQIGQINQDVIVDIPFMATKGGSGKAYTIALESEPVSES